jgi:hypothetical protein
MPENGRLAKIKLIIRAEIFSRTQLLWENMLVNASGLL